MHGYFYTSRKWIYEFQKGNTFKVWRTEIENEDNIRIKLNLKKYNIGKEMEGNVDEYVVWKKRSQMKGFLSGI